jgi:polysaccharide pyruvyl transferase WcaK-like protein
MKQIKQIKQTIQFCLFTATGAENLGDELITLTEVQHLQKIYPDCHITVFSHDIWRTRRFFLSQNISLEKVQIQEYFPNFLRKKPLKNIRLLWETLRLMRNSDHVYVGGG